MWSPYMVHVVVVHGALWWLIGGAHKKQNALKNKERKTK